MNTGGLIKRMINFYQGNLHDINHFLKVYAYAKAIGECEGLDELTQTSLEVRPSSATSPARFAGRSMAMPMDRTRSRNAPH